MMPPLTDSQLYEAHRAKLESLIADLVEARRSGNDPAIMQAKNAISDYFSPYDDLNQEAQAAFDAAHIGDLGQAVSEFSRIASRIGQEGGEVKSGFERARAAAQSGKKELLIPKVAETATRTLSELKELEGGIKKVVQQAAGDVHDLQGVADLLPDAISKLEELKQVAKDVGIDLP